MSAYSLRPHKPGRPDLKDTYKIFVPPKLWTSLRATTRDLWNLEVEGKIVATGKVSQAQEHVENKVLLVTHEFKELFGLNFTDSYTIKKSEEPIRPAQVISLVEQRTDTVSPLSAHDSRELGFWTGFIKANLIDKLVSPGLLIEDIDDGSNKRSFKVKSVTSLGNVYGHKTPLAIHSIPRNCAISIEILCGSSSDEREFKINRDGLFGMDDELETIDEILGSYDSSNSSPSSSICGTLLIVGASGTGKSLIADRLAKLPWAHSVILTDKQLGKNPGESLTKLFEECLNTQPCLIKIPHLDSYLPEVGMTLQLGLRNALDIVRGHRVLIMAEMEESKMPHALSSRFKRKIRLSALNESARRDLLLYKLRANNATVHAESNTAIIISQKTPGFSGRDMEDLVNEAVWKAQLRRRQQKDRRLDQVPKKPPQSEKEDLLYVTINDLEQARLAISPSLVSNGQLLKPRTVRWAEIGGQEDTKKKVEMLFEWPLKYPEKFKAVGMKPGKGLLLFGPPGCSKTMTALALATEAKLNFIAIKGAELLSKYVGQSEQNLREIFARARNAAPCVIFFDEIDAIGSSTMSAGEGRGSVNLVTTLLNELDGVNEMEGVSVLAATNRPWELDQALLRSGRFDGMIYVRLPDERARRQILQIRLDTMQHDPAIDIEALAKATEGCSGAELVNLCQNAGSRALEAQIHLPEIMVKPQHFDEALQVLRRDTTSEMVALFDAFATKGRTI